MSSPQTLLEALAERARAHPEDELFRFFEPSTGRETPVRVGELWAQVESVAAELRRRGLEPGDRVVVALPNGGAFFAAFFGIQRAQGVAVPLFPGSSPARILAFAHRSGARAAIVRDGVPELESLWRLTLPVESREGSFEEPWPEPGDLAFLQYTSGSTGEPKGVELTHGNLLTNAGQMIEGMEITPEDVFVSWLPVHHDMGLILMTLVPFYLGARLVLMPASLATVRSWLEAIERHRGTVTAAPDFAYRLCLRAIKKPAELDLSSLRLALDAAEPVRPSTLEDFERAFGLENVLVPGYGLAEATVGVSAWKPGRPAAVDERGFVSVGHPFPEIEISIHGEEGERPVGEVGEIRVRSPAACRGYFGDPEASAELFSDGALKTGDLGHLDSKGRLYVVGREKNVIFHAGRTLAPQEVETWVDTFEYVRYSAACGIDRGRLEGEQLYVFAEIRSGPETSKERYQEMTIEIVQALHRELGLRPARVYLLAPRSIPRTVNGKLQHAELKRRYTGGDLRREGAIRFPPW